MTARPRLAVCIPTFDRGDLLGETLARIAEEDPDIEVVVSDNASTDDTARVVAEFAAVLPRLRYVRHSANVGADRNFLNVVRLASAEYCWLLGSDDLIARGGVSKMRAALERAPDVVLCDRENRSRDMTTSLGAERFLSAAPGTLFECADHDRFEEYLQSALGIAGAFSYLSSIVVRRDAWEGAPVREEFVGSLYIHATKVLDILRGGGSLLYVGAPLVSNRTGNDTFAGSGLTRRRIIDLNYVRIAHGLFADDPALRDALLRVVERQFFSVRAILSDKRYAAHEGPAAIAALRVSYEQLRGRPWYRAKMCLWAVAPAAMLDIAHRALTSSAERRSPGGQARAAPTKGCA